MLFQHQETCEFLMGITFDMHKILAESLAIPQTVGEYTIGVFRISLVEPDLTQRAALRCQYDEVEPTVFQLQGSVTTN